jgi:hypothetical protein
MGHQAAFEGFHHEIQRVIDACPGTSQFDWLQIVRSWQILLQKDLTHLSEQH